MDLVQQAQTSGSKPSGIPKLSKLPVPRTRNVVTPTPSADEANEAVPAKYTSSTSRLQKRASIASFSRSTQNSLREVPAAAKPSSTADPNRVARHSAKPSHVSRTVSVSSRSNVRKAPSAVVKRTVNGEDGENVDQLSSLDFRSASRHSLRGDSPLECAEENGSSQKHSLPGSRKSSRPSLSDRTMESLQNVPSTPKDRRRSSFFNPTVSPMGPPHRPASSMSRDGSHGSRPGTSDGVFAKVNSRPSSPDKRAPASAAASLRTAKNSFGFGQSSANRKRMSTALTGKLKDARTSTRKATSPTQPLQSTMVNGRPSKLADGDKGRSRAQPQPVDEDVDAPIDPAEEERRVASNSSAALRQQIAAAKAAARKERTVNDSHQDLHDDSTNAFQPELHTDPFNQAPRDEKHILRNRINDARMSGRLNIAAMGLQTLPEEVRKMYDAAAMEESNVNWAEVVDLTRFIAADNALEGFEDDVFPDRSADEFAAEEFSEGNQFGGLELLDLHGNMLQTVPLGLRRLERLTILDLARNKLDNAALDIVSQIMTLKELKLGHNALTGNLPTSFCSLSKLETLELQANRLLGLPEALRELVSLRVLNVSGNQLTTLPMEALQQLPLHELDASSNALLGSLFPLGGISRHLTLQTLNVANNSLAALTFSEALELPQLRDLNVTNNHLTLLPDMSGWTELVTLMVGDNKLSELPSGFTTLQKLRHVNFTSNDIRLLDVEISRMRSLESLVLAANPLREKKFLTMNATDIKRDLKLRLAPSDVEESSASGSVPGSPVTVIGAQDAANLVWTLRGNGLLDLSSNGFSDDVNDVLGSFLKANEVKQLHLQSNHLSCVPPALWLGQNLRILDVSDNAFISSDYLSAELSLPALQDLNLSRCRLTSLEPLTSHLQAPSLQVLNVSANRLTGAVPQLRALYPQLNTLLASDNRFESIDAAALRGLHAVNLKSNDIQQLPAEIGLLWDEGLRSFEVGSNAFRVPNYRVLDKGTEATLRWLRDRLPVAQE